MDYTFKRFVLVPDEIARVKMFVTGLSRSYQGESLVNNRDGIDSGTDRVQSMGYNSGRVHNSLKECYDAFLQLTKGASLAKGWLRIAGSENSRNQSPELERRGSNFLIFIRSRSPPSSLLKS
ncbi:hypothetical protein AVEN_265165-1 [Araneus ventricosus]|uniref:Uncharacterized protein n=1 Tax=Araneus ventricosus TaxID=182803 RepID=A0A4Y2CP18_ARAVE|nr:hypothetical protein AVEN_265165-1 [Araneus ventricosus]